MIKKFNEFKKFNESQQINESTDHVIKIETDVNDIGDRDTIDINIMGIEEEGRIYEISLEETKRILRQNKFNDDVLGQICASDEGPDDEDPYWLYIEDTSDEEEFESLDDYKYFYLVVATERGTVAYDMNTFGK
ncbi:MAG: hypothetical protein SLAVMIC_00562 [uncultured marine phage]|uniref:Uncharacterized protein n=1 Tax=uncultured marine phage TaxID=707152 RepID=A0A8D9CFD7_9VIRU|nr:MAG: hypothetical protein SLAVMIC_00562 [uncultured marine phage]